MDQGRSDSAEVRRKSASVGVFQGTLLGSASADGRVIFFSTRLQEKHVVSFLDTFSEARVIIPQINAHELGINDFAWSPTGRFLVTASDDTTIKYFEVANRSLVHTFKGHSNYVFCVNFNPQGNIIVSGSFDTTVRLWYLETGTSKIFRLHPDPITSVAFNRDGSLVASGSYEGCIRLWNTDGLPIHKKILADEESAPVSHVKFSPNGKYILSSNLDGKLKLWDFAKGKCLKDYSGHVNSGYCIPANFSISGGKFIVSGSEDNNIYIWNLQTREIVQKLEGHTTPVMSTDCHPRRNIIVSAALEPEISIMVWESEA
uniref:WD_REPEATS_REGION domain-containing protein n=1 Tax=Caenorhabditis tropicalis TaxID=1561998 RepID=A0A1I7TLG3_9PELO